MQERLRRTQILLEPEQHQALSDMARREGRSLSEVVREMVRQGLAERQQLASAVLSRQLAALERIRRHQDEVLAQRGGKPLVVDVVELIRQGRDEQDAKNLSGRD